jgi:carbamoyltransferase
MYAAITDYLGFDILDGEFKVMGIAPYGDPDRYDLSFLARFDGNKFYVDNSLITTVGIRRYKAKARSYYFSKKLVDKLGPRRAGPVMDDPYVHYAAAIQKLYEDLSLKLIDAHLDDVLDESGRLAVAGTGSMNIRLNRRLLQHPKVKELVVTPLCGDAGTAAGAAAVIARKRGHRLSVPSMVSLGPRYSTAACIEACRYHREKPRWEQLDSPHERAATLLSEGKVIAWFRGNMEFGQRSLGNRCILANPAHLDARDAVNSQVKFREDWRPYSPSVMDKVADDFFAEPTRDEFMCISVAMSESAKQRFPGLMTADGTTRAQVVKPERQADFYKLFEKFFEQTGEGVLINATLCRAGEALVCSPEDALNVFMGTDLDYLFLENLLVTKREISDNWGSSRQVRR